MTSEAMPQPQVMMAGGMPGMGNSDAMITQQRIAAKRLGQIQNQFTKKVPPMEKLFKKMGLDVSAKGLLKQSQIFTGTLGAIFQILGAFIDITLAPMLPMIVPFIRKMVKMIPMFKKLGETIRDIIMGVHKWTQSILPKFMKGWAKWILAGLALLAIIAFKSGLMGMGLKKGGRALGKKVFQRGASKGPMAGLSQVGSQQAGTKFIGKTADIASNTSILTRISFWKRAIPIASIGLVGSGFGGRGGAPDIKPDAPKPIDAKGDDFKWPWDKGDGDFKWPWQKGDGFKWPWDKGPKMPEIPLNKQPPKWHTEDPSWWTKRPGWWDAKPGWWEGFKGLFGVDSPKIKPGDTPDGPRGIPDESGIPDEKARTVEVEKFRPNVSIPDESGVPKGTTAQDVITGRTHIPDESGIPKGTTAKVTGVPIKPSSLEFDAPRVTDVPEVRLTDVDLEKIKGADVPEVKFSDVDLEKLKGPDAPEVRLSDVDLEKIKPPDSDLGRGRNFQDVFQEGLDKQKAIIDKGAPPSGPDIKVDTFKAETVEVGKWNKLTATLNTVVPNVKKNLVSLADAAMEFMESAGETVKSATQSEKAMAAVEASMKASKIDVINTKAHKNIVSLADAAMEFMEDSGETVKATKQTAKQNAAVQLGMKQSFANQVSEAAKKLGEKIRIDKIMALANNTESKELKAYAETQAQIKDDIAGDRARATDARMNIEHGSAEAREIKVDSLTKDAIASEKKAKQDAEAKAKAEAKGGGGGIFGGIGKGLKAGVSIMGWADVVFDTANNLAQTKEMIESYEAHTGESMNVWKKIGLYTEDAAQLAKDAALAGGKTTALIGGIVAAPATGGASLLGTVAVIAALEAVDTSLQVVGNEVGNVVAGSYDTPLYAKPEAEGITGGFMGYLQKLNPVTAFTKDPKKDYADYTPQYDEEGKLRSSATGTFESGGYVEMIEMASLASMLPDFIPGKDAVAKFGQTISDWNDDFNIVNDTFGTGVEKLQADVDAGFKPITQVLEERATVEAQAAKAVRDASIEAQNAAQAFAGVPGMMEEMFAVAEPIPKEVVDAWVAPAESVSKAIENNSAAVAATVIANNKAASTVAPAVVTAIVPAVVTAVAPAVVTAVAPAVVPAIVTSVATAVAPIIKQVTKDTTAANRTLYATDVDQQVVVKSNTNATEDLTTAIVTLAKVVTKGYSSNYSSIHDLSSGYFSSNT